MEHDLPGLAGLSKLRHLDLSYNCLNANDLESLGKLFSLEVLHLEFTAMVGTLPASGDLLQLIMPEFLLHFGKTNSVSTSDNLLYTAGPNHHTVSAMLIHPSLLISLSLSII
jgi:hypothetical protein